MVSKSTLGKTNKYSDVVSAVKQSQPTEEPKITPEEIVEAFKAFGFEPGERNHDDITYWSSKPRSTKSQLIEELHRRRVDSNKKEDEKSKIIEQKQLSDQQEQEEIGKQLKLSLV